MVNVIVKVNYYVVTEDDTTPTSTLSTTDVSSPLNYQPAKLIYTLGTY